MVTRKPWLIPSIILVLLILAIVFRWEYTATKTTVNNIFKWKFDRWTNQQWAERYSIKYSLGDFEEYPIFEPAKIPESIKQGQASVSAETIYNAVKSGQVKVDDLNDESNQAFREYVREKFDVEEQNKNTESSIRNNRNRLTTAWQISLIGTLLWLIYVMLKNNKNKLDSHLEIKE